MRFLVVGCKMVNSLSLGVCKQKLGEQLTTRAVAKRTYDLVRQLDQVTLRALPTLQSFHLLLLVKANWAGVEKGYTLRGCWE